MLPIWPGNDPVLVADHATVWWLDLVSPFGDSPAGIDWTIQLPDGLRVLHLEDRPTFGCGPDAHRPYVERHPGRIEISVPGPLPGTRDRRPMTHQGTWSDLHLPLVVVGETKADGGELVITRRAMGDSTTDTGHVQVLPTPPSGSVTNVRRAMQLTLFPWLARDEQEAAAATLRACGITDCSLNWFDHGLPLLPMPAYADAATTLRLAIPGVRIWIGGHPGADTALPRANDVYGRAIAQLPSPEAAISSGRSLVAAAERSWCEAVDADGVMLLVDEPSTVDTAATPAHCFSLASRRRFAQELDLPSVPEALAILHHHREAWAGFCCRQVRRLLEVARDGHDGRPLALCALGPGGTARDEASADWRELAEVADVMIYAHQSAAQPGPDRQHWGYTRLGGMPQSWWEEWHDPLGSIGDPDLAVADARMQLALAGGEGVRIGSWAHLDGRLQAGLMAW